MARPNEFMDLTTTSVTVERKLLERAKAEGLNVSDVLRKALREVVIDTPPEQKGKLEKFRGLPKHIVKKA